MIGLHSTGLLPTGVSFTQIQGSGDTTAPTLTSPTGTNTGKFSAVGSVSTNESGGILYFICTQNPTATAQSVKNGNQQPVNAFGTQNVTITGLTANTAYHVHFLHADQVGNESSVASSPQWQTEAETPPAGTTSITNANATNESVIVTFTYSGMDATQFQYSLDGGNPVTFTSNPLVITGLQPSTNYSIVIRPINDGGNGNWSTARVFTTAAEPSVPSGTVTIGSVSGLSNTSATIPFTYSGADQTGFQYSLNGTSNPVSVPGNTSPITLTGLTSSTAYTIQVRAVNSTGNGAWSTARNFTTTSTSVGTLLLSGLVTNTGSSLANTTGVVVDVIVPGTGANLVRINSLAVNSSGSLTVTHANIIPGSAYDVIIRMGTSKGLATVIAS